MFVTNLIKLPIKSSGEDHRTKHAVLGNHKRCIPLLIFDRSNVHTPETNRIDHISIPVLQHRWNGGLEGLGGMGGMGGRGGMCGMEDFDDSDDEEETTKSGDKKDDVAGKEQAPAKIEEQTTSTSVKEDK